MQARLLVCGAALRTLSKIVQLAGHWSALGESLLPIVGCANLRSDRGTIALSNRHEIGLGWYFKGAIRTKRCRVNG